MDPVRNPQKRQYHMLNVEQKNELLQLADNGYSIRELMAKFNVTEGAVRYIKKKREEVVKRCQVLQELNDTYTKKRLKGIEDTALEKCIYEWCRQRRERKEPISGPIIREKAKWFNAQLNGSPNFVASDGWLSKFKKRHGMRGLKIKGEKMSSDQVGAVEFVKWFKEFLQKEMIPWSRIYNADETGLSWRALPSRTLVMGDEKEAPGFKVSKERVTIMVCANATGTHKIPLQVIGKSKKPRCFKNSPHIPVVYTGQKNAWMDRQLFKDWYTNVFLPEIKSRKENEDGKFLLLLDNCPAHPSPTELNTIDPCCTVICLPPNTTAILQPMDQGVIEALKEKYSSRFLQNLLLASEQNNQTLKDFEKSWNILDCCKTLCGAWDSVSMTATSNAWKKIRGNDENMSLPRSRETSNLDDIVKLANKSSLLNVPSTEENTRREFVIDDIERWMKESDSEFCPTIKPMSDTDILEHFDNIASFYTEEESDDCSMQLDDSIDHLIPTNREAIDSCNILYKWLLSQPNSSREMFKGLEMINQYVTDISLSE